MKVDGNIDKHKTRLVKRFNQHEDMDYFDICPSM
jgi:hypothetical protein